MGIYLLLILGLTCVFVGCNSELTAPDGSIGQFQQSVGDLQADTTYYWKLIAYPQAIEEFYSETTVFNFHTSR